MPPSVSKGGEPMQNAPLKALSGETDMEDQKSQAIIPSKLRASPSCVKLPFKSV